MEEGISLHDITKLRKALREFCKIIGGEFESRRKRRFGEEFDEFTCYLPDELSWALQLSYNRPVLRLIFGGAELMIKDVETCMGTFSGKDLVEMYDEGVWDITTFKARRFSISIPRDEEEKYLSIDVD